MKSSTLALFKANIFLLFILASPNTQAGDSALNMKPEPYSYEVVQGQKMSIQFVSKKVIKLMGNEYAIGNNTVIIGENGEKLDISALKKGMHVEIVFDDKQRYLNRPTLSRIHVH